MNKYLLILSLMILASCSGEPRFKVGDCIQFVDPYKESWERSFVIHKIVEVGKHSYRTSAWSAFYWTDMFTWQSPSDTTEFSSNYKKVECPK